MREDADKLKAWAIGQQKPMTADGHERYFKRRT